MPQLSSGALPPQSSAVFEWATLPVTPTSVGERRHFCDAPTQTFRNFECHATTLNPGETPHAPHRHPDEEFIIVKEGIIEVTINGATRLAGAGSLVFLASNDFHGLHNPGPERATYHVIRIVTADTPST